MRPHSLVAIVFLLLLFVPVLPVNSDSIVKIMPLGNSITWGDNNGGYRQKLYLDLSASFEVDFVGSLSWPSSPNPDFDTDHEGHPGWQADDIRDEVYDFLVENPADIVLLHIGTNDISNGNEDVEEVEDILDNIDSYSMDVTVILALITLRTDDYDLNETTKLFNDEVETMALNRIDYGDDIIIVDMASALTYPDDMEPNSEHPNADGYEKMADVWYEAIYAELVKDQVLAVERLTSWQWGDDTSINSVVEADVDDDGDVEVVTGGYYFDGVRDVAQLVVWSSDLQTVENLAVWFWTGETRINSVAVGNFDVDANLEIVTGGYYYDGTRDVAQLVVWDGGTLAVDNLVTWYWTRDTCINSVDVGDVDDDGDLEIVSGGYFHDRVYDVAQLVVWDGETLAVDRLTTWYWTGETRINSVAVGNVDSDGAIEIVTGGYYTDGVRKAQLVTWNGADLAVEDISAWYWTSDTVINSIAVGDVDGDSDVEVVSGGYYTDGVRKAQLVTWNGADLAVEDISAWYWTSDTEVNSVAVGDVDDDGAVEVVTGGYYFDGVRDVAQLVTWDGSTLGVEPFVVWYWTSDTRINSVAVGNTGGDGSLEIVTGGYYDDGSINSQLVIWTMIYE